MRLSRPLAWALVAGLAGGSLVAAPATASAAGTSTLTVTPAADAVVAGTAMWTTGWTVVRAAADDDGAIEVHLGPRYAVTLTGGGATGDGVAWDRVSWSSPSGPGTGWVRAAALTATQSAGDAYARVDALSRTLASYLAAYGSRVGVEVLDATRHVVYSYNAGGTFITASSMKVPIMLAVMARAEAAHRSLTSTERSLLTSMIERSDNSAASSLYALVGGRAGLAAWARKFGISGLVPEGAGGGWGYSTIQPSTMIVILERLRTGRLTSSADRAYALYLMREVISAQRFGVGTGSPAGATVAMKDGWVVGPDGKWAVNSSGIVTLGGETWVISIYTRGNATFSTGNAVVTHVASVIGGALK